MNRSSEAKNWADLEKDLLAEYAARTSRINPAGDESLLKLELRPLAFSVATLEQQEEVPE